MDPEHLASELGISGKTLRSWLRRSFPRPLSKKWQRWQLSAHEARAARAHFGNRVPRLGTAIAPRRRSLSDEAYVIDVCDELLQERALRQHRFDWLRGDPGKGGRRSRLPVDAYYPGHSLVIEYDEPQHANPAAFFDKESVITVSGVHRGIQRRLYGERMRTEIPKHALKYIVIGYSELDSNSRGRLRRNAPFDKAEIQRILSEHTGDRS